MTAATATAEVRAARPSLLRGVIVYTFRALTGAYALSLIGALLLRATVGESMGILALFYSLLHLLVIPAPFLLLVMLIVRQWQLALLLAVGAAVAISAYVPDFLPKSAPGWAQADDAKQITLLTYNLWSQRDVDDAIAVIREADADFVALQELSPPAAATFEAAFAEEYPYRVLEAVEGRWTAGQGFMSRYPIIDGEFWLSQQGNQRFLVDVDGTQIAVYNVHAAYPLSADGTEQRHEDVNDLLVRTAAESVPVVMLGDFNLTPFNTDYGRLTDRFTDAHRAIGSGPGWTFTFMRMGMARLGRIARLDYLFYEGDHFAALEAAPLADSGGSDHAPVYVRLAMQ
jgi:vancomycin resistance protein VanJ